MTETERKVVAICCYDGSIGRDGRYRWFDLPHPMTKREAERWADKNCPTPADKFRYEQA